MYTPDGMSMAPGQGGIPRLRKMPGMDDGSGAPPSGPTTPNPLADEARRRAAGASGGDPGLAGVGSPLGGPKNPASGAMPPASVATPQLGSVQQAGSYDPSGYDFSSAVQHGKGSGFKALRRGAEQEAALNAMRGNAYFWNTSLPQLEAAASPNAVAQTFGPRVGNLDDTFHNAEAGLTANLAQRGLGDSSAMASGLGKLAAMKAEGVANLQNDAAQRVAQQQAAIAEMMRGEGGSNLASLFGATGQDQTLAFEKWKAEQQNNPWAQVLGAGANLAGKWIGAGMPGI